MKSNNNTKIEQVYNITNPKMGILIMYKYFLVIRMLIKDKIIF